MLVNDRIPTRDELFAVIDQAFRVSSGAGNTHVQVVAYWQGSTRWARNRIGASSNRVDCRIYLSREIDGGWGNIVMNQLDHASIASAIRFAEWKATTERSDQKPTDFPLGTPEYADKPAIVWSDATANYDAIDSGKIVQLTCARAEKLGLMAAGYIECTSAAAAYALYDTSNRKESRNHAQLTRGECSVTARNPTGLGSGWSGITEIDFAKVDEEAIANRAFDKCLSSMNPVRVEPGRYTTILEPQAVADLVGPLLFANGDIMDRKKAETKPHHPFYLDYDPTVGLNRSKLGLKLFDERINVWHDPLDPELGVIGFTPEASGIKRISYVERGVLTSLPYDKLYSANRIEESGQNIFRKSFRMSGGDTTLEEMIATTKRGILVTRFSGGSVTDASALVATGLTRDGLWLVENGKIRHAIRNFRTLESPFFVLNNVEQIGPPQKVFAKDVYSDEMLGGALRLGIVGTMTFLTKDFAPQYIVPPLKVKDFSFSATIDAV